MRRRLVGLWWSAQAAVVLVGAPLVLRWLPTVTERRPGWPFPNRIPAMHEVEHALSSRLPADFLGVAIFAAAWSAWMWFGVLPLVLEVASRATKKTTPRLPLGLGQGWAWRVVTGVLLLVPTEAHQTARPTQQFAGTLAVAEVEVERPVVRATFAAEPVERASVNALSPQRPSALASEEMYKVRRGDSIWRVARARLAAVLGRRPTNRETNDYTHRIIRATPTLAPPRNSDLIYGGEELVEPAIIEERSVQQLPPPQHEAPATAPAPPPAPLPPPPVRAGDGQVPAGDGSEPAHHRHGGMGLRLPSGSVVGIDIVLLAGELAAATRSKNRRAYSAQPPAPGVATNGSMPEPLPTLLAAASQFANAVEDGVDIDGHPNGPASAGQLASPAVRLAGATAPDAARALILAKLGRSEGRLRVIIDGSVADELFGSTARSAGLAVMAGPSAVLDEAEIERARRERIIGDLPGISAYRDSDGDELLDDVLVVGRATPSDIGRWTALAEAGPSLGIELVLVDGLDVGTATVDVGQAPALVDEPGTAGSPTTVISRLRRDDAGVLLAEVASSFAEPSETAPRPPEQAFDFERVEQNAPSERQAAAVSVRVFGMVAAAAGSAQARHTPIRNAGRELLGYLVLNPGGGTRDTIIDGLWPDVDFDKARANFKNALQSLREDLREIVGRDDIPVVETDVVEAKSGFLYRLQVGLFDIDLWRFQGALRDSACAPTRADRVARLRDALDAYTGEFIEGSGAFWVITQREDFRQKALDTAVSIAEAEEADGNPEGAIAAVQRAIEVDRYAEDLYVREVRLLAALGRIESARKLSVALESAMAELHRRPMAASVEAIGRAISMAERHRSAREVLDHRSTAVDSTGDSGPGANGSEPPSSSDEDDI